MLLIVANGLAGLFFLLVHVVLGRWMSGTDYALLVSLIGLLNVLSVGANSLQLTVARFTAARPEPDAWRGPLLHGARRLAFWIVPLVLGWSVVSLWLRSALGAPLGALIVLGVIAALQLFTPLAQGLLQGLRFFAWFAIASVLGAFVRWSTAWGIAVLGGGVTAVLFAFLLGAVATLGVCLWPVRSSLVTVDAPEVDLKPMTGYFWRVAAGQIALFTLINADLILAPRLLEGEVLAAYGKAAILARTVIFLPLPLVAAMFPRAVGSTRWRVVLGPAVAVLVISSSAALVLWLWPTVWLRLMFGGFETLAPELLQRYVWAAIPIALVEILLPWLWARDRLGLAMSAVIPMAVFLVFLLGLHDAPERMITAVGGAGWLVLAWLGTGAAMRRLLPN